MELIRTDIISVFDLRFDGDVAPVRDFLSSRESSDSSRIVVRLEESFSWLFYGEQLQDFELIDITSRLSDTDGAVLRINNKAHVGTFIVWRTYRGESDPHELKKTAWDRCEEDLNVLQRLCGSLRIERYYPFVAIQADTDDVDAFAKANAEQLGRILTGDLEGERPSTLHKYIDGDLSLRSYEKLLIRWTEALAVYSRVESEEFYEECMFRAVQVFEHCILARVSLLALEVEMEQFLRHLTLVTLPKWIKSRDLLTTFSNIEETFVMYPRVQSVEADRLISAAHANFGIDKVLAGAKAKKAELQDQLAWAKAQTLGVLAFITYLFDKVIGWENLRCAAINGVHHFLR